MLLGPSDRPGFNFVLSVKALPLIMEVLGARTPRRELWGTRFCRRNTRTARGLFARLILPVKPESLLRFQVLASQVPPTAWPLACCREAGARGAQRDPQTRKHTGSPAPPPPPKQTPTGPVAFETQFGPSSEGRSASCKRIPRGGPGGSGRGPIRGPTYLRGRRVQAGTPDARPRRGVPRLRTRSARGVPIGPPAANQVAPRAHRKPGRNPRRAVVKAPVSPGDG